MSIGPYDRVRMHASIGLPFNPQHVSYSRLIPYELVAPKQRMLPEKAPNVDWCVSVVDRGGTVYVLEDELAFLEVNPNHCPLNFFVELPESVHTRCKFFEGWLGSMFHWTFDGHTFLDMEGHRMMYLWMSETKFVKANH